jgi:hypothetical protein
MPEDPTSRTRGKTHGDFAVQKFGWQQAIAENRGLAVLGVPIPLLRGKRTELGISPLLSRLPRINHTEQKIHRAKSHETFSEVVGGR